jgi:hypothetical protein
VTGRAGTRAAVVALLLFSAMSALADTPDRTTGVALLETYDEAYATGDLDDLDRLVEEDARFSTTLWFEGEMETVIVNRKRYFKAAAEIWRSGRPIRPSRNIVSVTVSPDGKEITVVSEVVIERMIDGRPRAQANRDVFLFAATDGTYRLRRHDAESRL